MFLIIGSKCYLTCKYTFYKSSKACRINPFSYFTIKIYFSRTSISIKQPCVALRTLCLRLLINALYTNEIFLLIYSLKLAIDSCPLYIYLGVGFNFQNKSALFCVKIIFTFTNSE